MSIVIEKETTRKVYESCGTDSGCIEIGTNPDAPEMGIRISTPRDDQYFGKIDFTISRECAKEVAEGILFVLANN